LIVVETNIIVCLHVLGPFTAQCEALLAQDDEWAAPTLWRSEFRNVLAAYLRRGALSSRQAIELQREAESLLAGAEYVVDSLSVLELVRDSDCSAYDCEFVALAKSLDVRFATMDSKLIRAFPKIAIAAARH
jgi:predicted nucleic acid-binding protein